MLYCIIHRLGGKACIKAIFFDLDGTLTESGEGITKSVQYALEKLGRPEPDLSKLRVFVGPPLMEQFMKYAELDEETARQAVVYYRERYAETGIYENRPYPGVEELLQKLRRGGLSSGRSFFQTGAFRMEGIGLFRSDPVFP